MNRNKIALDYVETGNGNEDFSGKKVRIPKGISSKMLYKDVFTIAWPSLVELTLTQLASMVDMIMVGKLGAAALTSIGLTTQPKFLIISVFSALNVGTTALVARYKGQNKPEKSNRILRQALLIMLFLSILVSVSIFIFSESIIKFMGATDNITLKDGTIYLQIQMLGITVLGLTSTITAALRGAGNSKTAMLYNLSGNLINVIFNYLLIYGNMGFPKLGVAGASIATVIGQIFAFIFSVISVTGNRNYIRIRIKDNFKPDLKLMKKISDIGIPALIEQLVMRTGMIIYAKTVASLGTVAFATHQICMNVQALSFMNGQAFAVSATSLVGQSLGKRREDMAKLYATRARRTGMSISVVLMLLFFFFPDFIVSLYNNDPEIIKSGTVIMMMMALIQVPQGSQFIVSGILRGAGDTKATAIITTVTTLIIRPALAIFMVNSLHWGLQGAWIALIIDQLLRSGLVLHRFNSGKWLSKIK